MQEPAKDVVNRVLGELLRAPEPLRDLEVERTLTRLLAARSDAPYLLLHRVLVLESALSQLRQRATSSAVAEAPGGAAVPAVSASPAATTLLPRGFLRDAAVVTLGVVAGQAVWDGLTGPDTAAGAESGLLDGLLD